MRVTLSADGPRLNLAPATRPPGQYAVRVRVELAGLCRSDLKEVRGDRHGVGQFGHELVGVIEESTFPDLPPGHRVTLDPNVPVERGTGFATDMWVAGSAIHLAAALPSLPPRVDARRLVFTEPLACAQHCLSAVSRHLGSDLSGRRVGVLGAGIAGVLIAVLARTLNAVVVLGNRSEDRASFVRASGILDAPIRLTESLPIDTLDVAVVATSFVRADILRQALRVIAPGGLVLLYGGTAPGDRLPGLDCDLDATRRSETSVATMWRGKPVRVGGSYGTVPSDFTAAVRALTRQPTLRVERLITREVRLANLPSVLQQQSTRRALGKTLVHT
ncbi:MAG: alcohol dehydrogenase catalytic domain-containing protein [Corynebacteriales bacterium]|nr:alcohol dehydrogenase catalytic domain-containing protein [Mycobacteriales bacterium]